MKKILSIVTIMLAMVLCFTGCGKITEDDIYSACANAKIGDTAVKLYCQYNPPEDAFYIVSNFDFFSGSYKEGSYYFSFDGYGAEDLSTYLGKKFNGYFYAEYDEYGYLDFALWFEDKAAYDAVINDIYGPLTMSEMRSYAEDGYLVGCYPTATVGY